MDITTTLKFHKQIPIEVPFRKYLPYYSGYTEGMSYKEFERDCELRRRRGEIDYNGILLKGYIRHQVPRDSGVYFMFYDDEVIYVGRSTNLQQRLINHCELDGHLRYADKVAIQFEESIPRQYAIEAVAIAEFLPSRNKAGRVC
ncbi:GIY-YIG nuclease family protein [Rossellomorea sp. LjRoot5]|uniref:GIY-YIG nuclease family protein n=1 Tax=Rossellomorea sp. LjRoot5 TaxID=3342331 RepID=UPI003ECCAD53